MGGKLELHKGNAGKAREPTALKVLVHVFGEIVCWKKLCELGGL